MKLDSRFDGLVDGLRHGRLDRREFFKRAAALGLAAPAIGVLIDGPDSAAAQDGDVLQIGRESEVAPLWHPFKAATGTQTQVFDLIFSRLLKVDTDLNLVPDAAESLRGLAGRDGLHLQDSLRHDLARWPAVHRQ